MSTLPFLSHFLCTAHRSEPDPEYAATDTVTWVAFSWRGTGWPRPQSIRCPIAHTNESTACPDRDPHDDALLTWVHWLSDSKGLADTAVEACSIWRCTTYCFGVFPFHSIRRKEWSSVSCLECRWWRSDSARQTDQNGAERRTCLENPRKSFAGGSCIRVLDRTGVLFLRGRGLPSYWLFTRRRGPRSVASMTDQETSTAKGGDGMGDKWKKVQQIEMELAVLVYASELEESSAFIRGLVENPIQISMKKS